MNLSWGTMFESAELGNSIDKATFQAEVPALRQDLLNAQFDLAQSARFQVIILLSWAVGSGKREVVHTLMEWMDPRHIQTRAMGSSSEEERQRPEMWRFLTHSSATREDRDLLPLLVQCTGVETGARPDYRCRSRAAFFFVASSICRRNASTKRALQ